MLQIKRIYDEPAEADGMRILVDRLWPRGMSKEQAAIDLWLKEIAPSPGLRTWFSHKPERFKEFGLRYTDELAKNPAVPQLEELVAKSPVATLLYSARDGAVNHAVVLQNFLQNSKPKS